MDMHFDYEREASCVCCEGSVSHDTDVLCATCILDGWRWCVACKRTYVGHGVESYGFCQDCSGRLGQLSEEELDECPF